MWNWLQRIWNVIRGWWYGYEKPKASPPPSPKVTEPPAPRHVPDQESVCQDCYSYPCQCNKPIVTTGISRRDGAYSTAAHRFDDRTLKPKDKSDDSCFIATPEGRDWYDNQPKDAAYYLALSNQIEKTRKRQLTPYGHRTYE